VEQAMKVFQGAIIDTRTRDFDLVSVDLETLPPPEVIGFRLEGDPKVEMRVLWMSDDKRKAVAIERCSPGRLIVCDPPNTTYFNLFYFMEGHCTQVRTDGTTDEWSAGNVVCFTEGQYAESTIHETFLKCAYYSSSDPLPYEVTP
jgi:uncharacterized cupin superfamily protein